MNEQQTLDKSTAASLSRRRFIGYAGALAGVGLVAGTVGCKKSDDSDANSIDLGAGDTGVLNLMYALKQMQVAFYIQATTKFFTGANLSEQNYLNQIRDHEIAHRELLRKVLGTAAIKDITPDFHIVDFTKRTSVLDTAIAFEDLSVSAYNGLAKFITADPYLELAGKIGSVEARHAALVRDLRQMGTFADDSFVDSSGLDFTRDPGDILFLANAYIKERLNATGLPTS